MSDHKENARKVHEAVRPVLHALHSRDGIPVRDINAALFGLVTRSMQADIGQDQAREFIESAMENVWGAPKNRARAAKERSHSDDTNMEQGKAVAFWGMIICSNICYSAAMVIASTTGFYAQSGGWIEIAAGCIWLFMALAIKAIGEEF